MKTILVTGAAGYIGRHVVKKALDMGYRVIASDFAFKGVDERAEFCDVPIFSGDKNIYAALGKPDVCIHMAWRDGFRHNAPSHMKDLSSHVTFLNNMAAGGLSDLTVMGTMHEVGYWEGAIEDDTPCNPLSQYGIAKNALRQSMMLSLQGSSCNLHWLRAYYITGDEAHGSSIFAKLAQAELDGKMTLPANVVVKTKEPNRVVLLMTIQEGRNRQIRRMCEALGLEVARLRRTSIGPLKLGMLKPGTYRDLTAEELRASRNAIGGDL